MCQCYFYKLVIRVKINNKKVKASTGTGTEGSVLDTGLHLKVFEAKHHGDIIYIGKDGYILRRYNDGHQGGLALKRRTPSSGLHVQHWTT